MTDRLAEIEERLMAVGAQPYPYNGDVWWLLDQLKRLHQLDDATRRCWCSHCRWLRSKVMDASIGPRREQT